MTEATTSPTWGYHKTQPAQIFDLKDGEALPDGWKDTPAAFDDDQKETAEAAAKKAKA